MFFPAFELARAVDQHVERVDLFGQCDHRLVARNIQGLKATASREYIVRGRLEIGHGHLSAVLQKGGCKGGADAAAAATDQDMLSLN